MTKELVPSVVQEGKTLSGFDADDDEISFEEIADRVAVLIERDRLQAIAEGNGNTTGWTNWRRMEMGEWIGAARCGSSEHADKHTRRKQTEWVSYGVDFGGKLAICDDCYKSRFPKAIEGTAPSGRFTQRVTPGLEVNPIENFPAEATMTVARARRRLAKFEGGAR